MAYCKKCGAYIPDNQLKCLACGFDEGAAAAAAQQAAEAEREAAEARRRAQQEEDRKWAEAERAKRIREQRIEEARRWAEENRQRRVEQQHSHYDPNLNVGKKRTAEEIRQEVSNRAKQYDGSKILAFLSYCGPLFILPMLFAKDDSYANFHAKQGLNLFIFNIIADVATAIFPLIGLVKLASVYFFFKGAINALNNRMEALPYIGNYKFF